MLDSIFSQTTTTVDLTQIILVVLTSIILGLILAFAHEMTTKSNKNFLITIATLPLLIAIVIIMVNGNLGTSVAVLGAFSLVRFRSLPGNSKEILSVFFAMTIGLVLGMGNLIFAGLITIIGSILLIGLDKLKIFDNTSSKLLKITIPENLDYTCVFDDVFKEYSKKCELVQVKTTNMGSMFDLTYNITLKEGIDEKKFMDDLRVKNGNLKIILTHQIIEGDVL